MTKVVGFLGARGAGKDTAAKGLVQLGWKTLAFGSGIYDEASGAFGVPRALLEQRETKETPLPEFALINCKDPVFVRIALMREDVTVPPRMDPRLAPRSPRFIMQTWGTEYRRGLFGNDYWTKQVNGAIVAEPTQAYGLTDVREHLEIDLVRRYNGPLIRIINPGLASTDATTMGHTSETAVSDVPVDLVIINSKREQDIPQLHREVTSFVNRWFAARGDVYAPGRPDFS